MTRLNFSPTFCMSISDMSLSRFGIVRGDILFCDREPFPARLVVAEWDGLGHVCSRTGQLLFDEASRAAAPENAVIIGRVLYAVHPFVSTVDAANAKATHEKEEDHRIAV